MTLQNTAHALLVWLHQLGWGGVGLGRIGLPFLQIWGTVAWCRHKGFYIMDVFPFSFKYREPQREEMAVP